MVMGQISGFDGIKKVFSYNDDWKKWTAERGFVDVKEPYFLTVGVNMLDLLDCQEVDHSRTICNDVLEVRVRGAMCIPLFVSPSARGLDLHLTNACMYVSADGPRAGHRGGSVEHAERDP